GPTLYRPRRAERGLGVSTRREHGELTDDPAVRREPLLPSRGQPLDRDAAGHDRHDHRRRVRVPPEAAGGLPGSAELLGARAALTHRVGLSPVPRLARALPDADAAR